MSQPSGKPIYVPPFSGVRLIECRDHFQLVPVPAVRTVYGYGKIKGSKTKDYTDDFNPMDYWTDIGPDDEIWCVVQWFVYEDGHKEPGNINFVRPECDEEEIKERMEAMMRMEDITREEALVPKLAARIVPASRPPSPAPPTHNGSCAATLP